MEYVYCRSNSPSCSYVRHCILTAPLFILELIEVLVDKTVKGKLLRGGVGGGMVTCERSATRLGRTTLLARFMFRKPK